MLAERQFNIRITDQEKRMLEALSKRFQRSKSDTIKTLIRGVYRVVSNEKAPKK